MNKELDKLDSTEKELILKAPLLVCLLIAGADNEIDKKEVRGAVELSRKKRKQANTALTELFEEVSTDFEDKLKILLESLPHKPEVRTKAISDELARLNRVLPKMGKGFSSEYYKALRYIAEKIAESSGGILGIKSVAEEEESLMALPMIKNPSAVG